jgi:hypothetical protein
MSEVRSPFSIGDIVVCTPMMAGASKYPLFGKISNIPSDNRYRILFLETTYPAGDRNTSNTSGSRKLIRPGNLLSERLRPSQKGLLAKWNSEHPNYLFSKSKHHHGCNFWFKHNPDQDYRQEHDNGD